MFHDIYQGFINARNHLFHGPKVHLNYVSNSEIFMINKKCANGTKTNPVSQNKVHESIMWAKYYLLCHIMIFSCRVWPSGIL